MADLDLEPIHFVEPESDRRAWALNISNKMDMSERVAATHRYVADANVKVAEATHAKPAKQETIRSGMAYGSLLAIMALSCLALDESFRGWVLIAGAAALGGGVGISQIIKTWKQAKLPSA